MPAQHIPTVRYHPSEPPQTIETAEALAALGHAWQDHPYTEEERAAWQAQQAPPDDAPPPQPRKR
jgi:hypothetical protein